MGDRDSYEDEKWQALVLAPIMVAMAAQESTDETGAAPVLAAQAVRPALEMSYPRVPDVPLLSALARDVVEALDSGAGRAFRSAWPNVEQAAVAATDSAGRLLRSTVTDEEQRAYRDWLIAIAHHVQGASRYADGAGRELAPSGAATLIERIEEAYAPKSLAAQNIDSIMLNVPANLPSPRRGTVILGGAFLLGLGIGMPALLIPVLVVIGLTAFLVSQGK